MRDEQRFRELETFGTSRASKIAAKAKRDA
jgi:hypothetical protein